MKSSAPDSAKPTLCDRLLHNHDRQYVNAVKAIAESGGGAIDPDTPVSPRTYEIALLAVNAWLDGVDTVMTSGQPVFVLARPPGHHAEPSRGMGFCIFSNAAIAATYALAQGAAREITACS
jgi:acetoin utilization deacetylase AcuC-like enzyme